MRLPVVTDFVTLLEAFDRIAAGLVGNGLAIDDRAPAGECRAGRLWTLCTIEIEVAVRLGWSGMALALDDPPWRRSCPASDRPPREQGTRGGSSGAGRRTVGRTGGSEQAALDE